MLLVVVLVCGLVWNIGAAPLVFMTVPMLVASMGSLVVRVSSTRESMRAGASSHESQKIWGGVLTEYGGVIPVVVLCTAVLGPMFGPRAAVLAMGIITSGALIAYEFSGFSVQSRYPGWIIMWLLAIASSALPLLGAAITISPGGSEEVWWIWSGVAIAVLTVRAVLMGRTAYREISG